MSDRIVHLRVAARADGPLCGERCIFASRPDGEQCGTSFCTAYPMRDGSPRRLKNHNMHPSGYREYRCKPCIVSEVP
jgi:hypothetical protein